MRILHAGPLSSPLGAGTTSALSYIIAPAAYNGTIPAEHNYTAFSGSYTVRCLSFSFFWQDYLL